MMFSGTKKRLWITLVVLVAGLFQLMPFETKPFDAFLVSKVKHDKEGFLRLLDQAKAGVQAKEYGHLSLALATLCQKQNLDLSTFFPQYNVSDIKNLTKKNQALLQFLLKKSQCVFKEGLDLRGGVVFTLEINENALVGKGDWEKQQLIQKGVDVITSRVDALGVSEPIVRARGERCIEVQLPGLSLEANPHIMQALKKPAKLEFRLVNDAIGPNDAVPLGYERLFLSQEDQEGQEQQIPIVVKRLPEMTGKSVREAHCVLDGYGKPEVSLRMTSEGKQLFATITKKNLNKRLAIVLDGKVCSAPVIRSEITEGQASISGKFTQREALELANTLNNPLEFELDLSEIYEVGPSLAASAKTSAIYAALVSVVFVMALLVFYYRGAGLTSALTLILNFVFIVIAWASIQVTITLPSITALALTFGMAVDANILILERVREEMRAGKDAVVSLLLGHKKAFVTILDANITTLLTAVLLIWFGTGPVKGFGITLGIGILTTLFSVLCFNRALFEILARKERFSLPLKSWLGDVSYDFMKHRWHAIAVSIGLFIIGCVATGIRGKSILGIDFVGGDELVLSYEKPVDGQVIRQFAKRSNLGEVNAVYQRQSGASNFLKLQTEKGKSATVLAALQKEFSDSQFKQVAQVHIGATVSKEVQKNAIISVIFALMGILLYVAFRFEFSYGFGATIALLHDTLITIGLYIALGHQFTAPMVAAVLMVIGYSINDTIIIFDRIREELKRNIQLNLAQVMNLAINKTLSRTLMTSLTTFIPAVFLYVFCSGVVSDYALVFLLGILVGTFSSIFIASPIFYFWNRGNRNNIAKPSEDDEATHDWMKA